jgi:molybdenum cofactor guanylyltransferase
MSNAPLPQVFILAGGRSSRFGEDKALAEVEGKPLILHVATAAAALPASIAVVADAPDKYAPLGLRTLADLVPGAGPLGGLLTALSAAKGEAPILLLSCDLLGLQTEWLCALLQADPTEAVALFDTEPLQPLLARYAPALKPELERPLAIGDTAMHRFVRAHQPLLLPRPAGWETLKNVNRREDLNPPVG